MKRTGTLYIILATLILSANLTDAAPYKRPYELPGYTGWQAAMKEVRACEDYLQMMQKDSQLYTESKKKEDKVNARYQATSGECYDLTTKYRDGVNTYNKDLEYHKKLYKQCSEEMKRTGLEWKKIEVCREADSVGKVLKQRDKKLDVLEVEENRVCKLKEDLRKQVDSLRKVNTQYLSKLGIKYSNFAPGTLEVTRKDCNDLRAWMKQEEKKLARNTLDAIINCEFTKADDLLKRLIPGTTQQKLNAHRDRILRVEQDVRSQYKTANAHYRNGQASEKKAHELFSRGDSKASLVAFQQAQAQYSKAIGVLESQLKKSECAGTRATLSSSLDKVKARRSAAQAGPGSQQYGTTVGGSLPCAKYNPLDPACESSASGQATPQQLAKVKSLAEQFGSALPDSGAPVDTARSSSSIPGQYSRPAEPSSSSTSAQQGYGSQYGGGTSQFDSQATHTDQFLKDVLPPPRSGSQTATTIPGSTQAGQTQTTVPPVTPLPPGQPQTPFSAVGTWTGTWTAQLYQDGAVAGRCVWDVEIKINAGMSGNLRMIGEGTAVVPDKAVACVQGDAPVTADVVADTVVLHTVGTERAYNFRLRILNNTTLEMTDSIDGAPTSGTLRKK